ncbi:ABC transporter ATP-binding protein [Frondihabitans sp. PAMC 28766]|uniref:dipeptide ABC transporter ATP-binding protein n=1 Tax=Frondihabitans sp. PAMC 28766 TaxID=1795630 RepID=UPI00078C8E7E|nr:ABC transporter ATP-binding protein [Frondihabitans sp. PAMC 28766]AMM21396.1 ABC transporter ATP-binding protein [Frondihabitans sp. PAMC 28766]
MSDQPLLSVKNLSVGYIVGSRQVEAVHGVSFDLQRGETVAIVGESGSGKTTTAHAVINLLAANARVSSDTLALDGATLTDLSRSEWQEIRGRRISLIPQDPGVSLNPVAKVGAQVAEVLRIHKLASRRGAERRAVELLALAGIPEPETRAKQYPHQLSGGMKQRVLIATALAADPELVIADEPTSALDVTVQRQILDHIDTLARERNTAILLITHDLAVAADRADRVIVMQHGRIVEQGAARSVLENPQHPYTRALVAAAPALTERRLVASDRAREKAVATGQAADLDTRPLLAARDLRKEFTLPGARHRPLAAVDGVSFEIARGETFALLGESGSGKSTTARLVTRLDEPTSGSLSLDGVDYTAARREDLRQLRRRFQLVYQNPYASLDPRFTIEAVIEEPLRAYRVGTAASRAERVARLIDDVALPKAYLGRRAAELSGGQRQRVAIARALALQPELLVLDEAVSALDVSVQAQILALLTDLQTEYHLSYLFITHDLAVVRQISDRVGVMRAGRIVETGLTADILTAPTEKYTRELIDAIPGSGRTAQRKESA